MATVCFPHHILLTYLQPHPKGSLESNLTPRVSGNQAFGAEAKMRGLVPTALPWLGQPCVCGVCGGSDGLCHPSRSAYCGPSRWSMGKRQMQGSCFTENGDLSLPSSPSCRLSRVFYFDRMEGEANVWEEVWRDMRANSPAKLTQYGHPITDLMLIHRGTLPYIYIYIYIFSTLSVTCGTCHRPSALSCSRPTEAPGRGRANAKDNFSRRVACSGPEPRWEEQG